MAQRAAPDGWDPPSVVQVTVEPGPGPPRAAGRRAPVLAAAGAVGIIAVLGVSLLGGRGGGPARHRLTPSAVPKLSIGAAQLAAAGQAYRFPLGCLRITRSPRALAGALRRRTGPCWRYGISVTAILRRIHGAWRLALELGVSQSARRPRHRAPVR